MVHRNLFPYPLFPFPISHSPVPFYLSLRICACDLAICLLHVPYWHACTLTPTRAQTAVHLPRSDCVNLSQCQGTFQFAICLTGSYWLAHTLVILPYPCIMFTSLWEEFSTLPYPGPPSFHYHASANTYIHLAAPFPDSTSLFSSSSFISLCGLYGAHKSGLWGF